MLASLVNNPAWEGSQTEPRAAAPRENAATAALTPTATPVPTWLVVRTWLETVTGTEMPGAGSAPPPRSPAGRAAPGAPQGTTPIIPDTMEVAPPVAVTPIAERPRVVTELWAALLRLWPAE